jgi:hypothetical protein
MASCAAALLVAGRGNAAPCPVDDVHTIVIADDDVEMRLSFLARVFDREVKTTDTWSWSWGSGYVALAGAQAGVAPAVKDRDTRAGLVIGSAASGFGALVLFGLPLQITLPLRAVRRRWAEPDRCLLLRMAEETLAREVRIQKLAKGPLTHIGNVAVNVGIALLMGLGFGQWRSAAISFGVGVAAGEGNAFTQPRHLERAEQDYRTGNFAAPPPHDATFQVGPIPVQGGAGIGATLAF